MSNAPTDGAIVIAVAKPKLTLLPLLVVLFLISYGLMAMLVVEQGRTIDTQKYLIRELFSDSTQLTALKGHEAQRQAQAKPRPQAQVQVPANPGNKAGSDRSLGKVRRLPLRPPKAASDMPDARRVLMSI